MSSIYQDPIGMIHTTLRGQDLILVLQIWFSDFGADKCAHFFFDNFFAETRILQFSSATQNDSYNEFITCFHESWIYETWFFPHEISGACIFSTGAMGSALACFICFCAAFRRNFCSEPHHRNFCEKQRKSRWNKLIAPAIFGHFFSTLGKNWGCQSPYFILK